MSDSGFCSLYVNMLYHLLVLCRYLFIKCFIADLFSSSQINIGPKTLIGAGKKEVK